MAISHPNMHCPVFWWGLILIYMKSWTQQWKQVFITISLAQFYHSFTAP